MKALVIIIVKILGDAALCLVVVQQLPIGAAAVLPTSVGVHQQAEPPHVVVAPPRLDETAAAH